MVLEHASMTNFCGIPLASLRENSITELNLDLKRIPQGVGVPGAIVLSKLLPSAAALTSLKCARPLALSHYVTAPSDTPPSFGTQLGRQPALQRTHSQHPFFEWPRHLHLGRHHQAVRGAQG